MQPAFAETADFYRLDASLKLDPKKQSDLGQYMTPSPIGRFMASLFSDLSGDIQVLDPGAGVGSLSAAFVERCAHEHRKPRSISLKCYETEPLLIEYLETTLQEAESQSWAAEIAVSGEIYAEDFILAIANGYQEGLFETGKTHAETFTHVIMNPPYRRLTRHPGTDQRCVRLVSRPQISTPGSCTWRLYGCAPVVKWSRSCLARFAMARTSSPSVSSSFR